MFASLWHDPGTWIALGISALFLVVAALMHRVIVKVLKGGEPSSPSGSCPDESLETPLPKVDPHD